MLLPQKQILLLKYPNELGCKNKHVTNGWVNLSVIKCFRLRAFFYCIQMNPLCKLYIESL